VDKLTVDLVFLLLVAAVGLFVLAATKWAKGWCLPIGLACVALALLIEWKW
jgi:hypothetical protein